MNHMRQHDHGSSDETDEGCPMIMLHAGSCEAILFKGATTKSADQFVLAFVVIFVVSIAYEGLKFRREKLYNDYGRESVLINRNGDANGTELPSQDKTPYVHKKSIRQLIIHKIHLTQTLLHLVQVIVSYSLMLIVMTYNVWLILAVVLGATVGYFFFGWIRQRSIDTNECCH